MASIYFHTENTELRIRNKTEIRNTLKWLVGSKDQQPGQLNYIFCNDEYLLGINQQYLNHSDLTDIITFNTSENDLISGDIFISVERVKENAIIFQNSFSDEMLRIIFHGILHLLGYKDKTESEVREMRSMEDIVIQRFKTNVTRETFTI